jgi:uncharacterized SAM-binding protein YcdF (DUF218 family)
MIDLSLSKLLGEALDPLAILWVVLFCIAWRFRKLKERKTSFVIFTLWILIWCFGATPLTGWLFTKLEQPYVVKDWDALPKADAVICLGGGLYPQSAEVLGITATDAVDRYLTAFDLIHSGKAENLVFGGSDYEVNGIVTSEGELLNQWRKRWGLVKGEVHFLNSSNTTRDEAVRVGELVESENWKTIYLVTSAWHMRRAKAVFLKSWSQCASHWVRS